MESPCKRRTDSPITSVGNQCSQGGRGSIKLYIPSTVLGTSIELFSHKGCIYTSLIRTSLLKIQCEFNVDDKCWAASTESNFLFLEKFQLVYLQYQFFSQVLRGAILTGSK